MKRIGSAALVAALTLTGALAGCRSQPAASTESGAVKTDVGVTAAPCPEAVDKTKGCIYLGAISDLTGPFAAIGVPASEGTKAFWKRVNANGGIAGKYEVNLTTKDGKYDPQLHNQVYQSMKADILALAGSIGSPTTAAILPDMKTSNIISPAGGYSSASQFEDNLLESGASYCVEAMNNVDYGKQTFSAKSVMAVHWPGDYGDDGAAGVKYAAQKTGLTFTDVPTGQGQDKQAAAVAAIVAGKPDLVILVTGPSEAAAIVGGAAAQGFTGKFIGLGPTWVSQLNASPAAPALAAMYQQSSQLLPWEADSPGHKAMREAIPTPNTGSQAAWVAGYTLKAALEKAVANKDITRAGLVAAAKSLTSVDYEGMLPAGSGNYAGGPAAAAKASLINKPDKAAPAGVAVSKDMFVGDTAKGFTPTKPCYLGLS